MVSGRPLLSTVVEIDLVGQISGGVRLDAPMRGDAATARARARVGFWGSNLMSRMSQTGRLPPHADRTDVHTQVATRPRPWCNRTKFPISEHCRANWFI